MYKMEEKHRTYDLILQDNGSKQFFVFSGLTDLSENHLYYEFNIDLSSLNSAEYTYAVYLNTRDDVEIEYKHPLLSSILHTEDGDVVLRDLQPVTGLLRVGKPATINEYDGGNETNTVFYYDN